MASDNTKTCTKCSVTKSLECFGLSNTCVGGYRTYCKTCHNAQKKQWRIKNADKIAEQKRQYYQDNRQHILNRCGEYAKANPHVGNAKTAKYRASKLNATPTWLTEDDDFIFNEVYEMAKLRSESTGVEHHVDHIVPLQGIEANGLHVWWNLQIIPASENLSKSNKL